MSTSVGHLTTHSLKTTLIHCHKGRISFLPLLFVGQIQNHGCATLSVSVFFKETSTCGEEKTRIEPTKPQPLVIVIYNTPFLLWDVKIMCSCDTVLFRFTS